MPLVALMSLMPHVALVRLVRLLMGLVLRSLVRLMCLVCLVLLMLLVVRLLLRVLLVVLLMAWVPQMRLVRGMRLLVLLVRKDGVMRDRLTDATGEDHGRRVWLGLHLLPLRGCSLSLDIEGIGNVALRRPRRRVAIGNIGVDSLLEEVPRVGTLRRLLRRVRLGLVGRGGVRRGRLLVRLVLVRVRGCESRVAT